MDIHDGVFLRKKNSIMDVWEDTKYASDLNWTSSPSAINYLILGSTVKVLQIHHLKKAPMFWKFKTIQL